MSTYKTEFKVKRGGRILRADCLISDEHPPKIFINALHQQLSVKEAKDLCSWLIKICMRADAKKRNRCV
jgi:hypothetical protein